MARNMSLFFLRTAEKIKNGSDTKVAVDASGSPCLRLKYNAVLTINKGMKSVIEDPEIMGKVLDPLTSSYFSSVKIVKSETAEKHNR